MKLLITGASGQLGKEWVDFCVEKKINHESYNSVELDITDERSLKNTFKDKNPDVIINCAAYTKVDEAESEKIKASEVNTISVKKMADICAELNIVLVHYSTDYVFAGSEEDQIVCPQGYPEDFKTDPINVYGYSKWAGEEAIKLSGCEYLILRVSWLCGRYGNNFVKTMIRLGNERDELSVVDDQVGSPTFTSDVVSHTFELINKKESGIYHLSSNGIISWYDFAKEIFAQIDIEIVLKPISSSEYPTKAKRPFFSKLSTQKISNIDGVEIRNWKDGLQRLLKQLT